MSLPKNLEDALDSQPKYNPSYNPSMMADRAPKLDLNRARRRM
eukprot:CAMPEP_0118664934 /NCGR_PEP_ID=MMETSP0785-20121206/18326_1 /TAXON_ID=91992 /ORGANISM="Bolidomonas pacifica, Strain CCMP 1866" /LENGTH=42 /DNA_ID= /DNA_START= /DNA_END= /DNA_ORIENTATION=